MTVDGENMSTDAIKSFKKRKYEEHQANRLSGSSNNKYPEGFGGSGGDFHHGQPRKKAFKGNQKSDGHALKLNQRKYGKDWKVSQQTDKKAWKRNQGNNGDASQLGEKKDWKKYKIEKKELKQTRQKYEASSNETYELGVQIKQIWEELRQENCKGSRQEQLCDKLFSLVQGKVKLLVFAHDTVRVIETLLAVGKARHRTALFEEMKSQILELVKHKYSRNFVIKMLMYGSRAEKNEVFQSFKGQVVKLMKHKTSCDAIEVAYNDYANASQRSMLLQEFYGPEFRLFHDEGITCLGDALTKHPEKKQYILKDMWSYIQPIIEKGVFTNNMVHTLLRDFLTHCAKEQRSSIIESIREGLAPIIHTLDGARVAMLCLWHGTNKDRKVILKSFRTHFVKIALDAQGYKVLLAAFDCMDDTEFMRKVVLNELMEDLPQLVSSDPGMKVLRYLIAPRDAHFFPPCIVKALEEGDGNETSKKDTALRRKELQRAVSAPILRMLLANIEEWSKKTSWVFFIVAALETLESSEIKTIFETLAKMFMQEYVPGNDHLLDFNHTVLMAKLVIKSDPKREENNRKTFSSILVNATEATIPSWINCNRGCFLLTSLIETNIEEIVLKIRRILNPLKEKLATLEFKGAEVLLSKL